MNKRQFAAIDRARRAVAALEKVGLSTVVGESGTLYAIPTEQLQNQACEMSNFALLQDYGDSFGGGEPLPGVL
jgi:hypothetical protein